MTETELTPLLSAFGLLPSSPRTVARPHLDRELRARLAKVKRAHRQELTAAKIMRTDVLNLTRGVARPRIVEELVSEGHTEAAYLLMFNDEQLALLMAWRDALPQAGSSSPRRKVSGSKRGKAGSSSTATGKTVTESSRPRRRRGEATPES